MYLTNKAFNEIIIRCMANGIETILNIIAFHYFLKIKDKFNSDYALMTIFVSINFMIRNTSAFSWIPLFLVLIFKEKALKPLIISLFLIAIPVLSCCIYLDSMFYGFDKVYITPYNFVRFNILEGYSLHFGIDPVYEYITSLYPICFTILVPFIVIS